MRETDEKGGRRRTRGGKGKERMEEKEKTRRIGSGGVETDQIGCCDCWTERPHSP